MKIKIKIEIGRIVWKCILIKYWMILDIGYTESFRNRKRPKQPAKSQTKSRSS